MIGRPQSKFVTLVAWIGILFSAVSTAIGALENALVWLFVPLDAFEAEMTRQLPGLPLPILRSFHWIVLAFWIASLVTLVASVGLLRRREWARIAFIVLLAASALATIVLTVGESAMMDALFADAGALPDDVQRAKAIVTILMWLLNVVIVVAHGWMIWKLLSPSIRAEFASTAS